MTSDPVNQKYIDILMDMVDPKREYTALLGILMDMEYYWILPMDENRAIDGLAMRGQFSTMYNIVPMLGSCKILEMLIALAWRMEEDVMQNDYYGDRSQQWFWYMLNNAGLAIYSDRNWSYEAEHNVRTTIFRIFNRQFDPDGDGGFFPLHNPHGLPDMRGVDFWSQAMSWLSENYVDIYDVSPGDLWDRR